MILAAICIQKQGKISSLKREIIFLQDSLNQFTGKETGQEQDNKEEVKDLLKKFGKDEEYQSLK
jgi:hypothetical protein